MKIFIIGATGYVGSAVARAALASGHEVTGLGHSDDAPKKLREAGVQPVEGDLSRPASLESAVRAADATVYAASSDYDADTIPQLLGWLRDADKSLVLIGGSSTYGDTGDDPQPADADFNPPEPLSGRAELEKQVLAAEGVRTAVVYGAFIYGREGGAIPQMMLSKAHENGAAYYVDGGKNTWSAAHVDDFGNLALHVVETTSASGKFVATAEAYTMAEIAQVIAQAAGVSRAEGVDPDKAQEIYGFFAGPLAMNQWYRADRAEGVGWQAKQPDLMTYLREGRTG